MAIGVSFDDSKLRIRSYNFNFDKHVKEALKEAVDDILIPAIKRRILANRSVFRGNLIGGIDSQIVVTSTGPGIRVGALHVPYATAVEKGTGPQSSVSFSRILAWVKAKNDLDGDDARKVAVAVVNTLRTKGAEPHPYLRVAFEHVREQLTKRFSERARRKLNG